LALFAGCVDDFAGSNVQFDFLYAMPFQASVGVTPGVGQLPAGVHFTLVGIQEDTDQDHLFELERFEIHQIVDLDSPCYIDVGDNVPYPGIHVSQYAARLEADTGITDLANPPATSTMEQQIEVATAQQRMADITALSGNMGIHTVTSASTSTYPPTGTDCSDTSADTIPPPMCDDDASNARRLMLCQAAWAADPDLWEGTDRVLTAPLNGTTHGFVDGVNPVNLAPVGGAQFFVPDATDSMTAYAVYYQTDDLNTFGTQLLFGRPTEPTRDVLHVHMVSTAQLGLTAEMAIFPDLDQDSVHF
jgi:hypothetical protein